MYRGIRKGRIGGVIALFATVAPDGEFGVDGVFHGNVARIRRLAEQALEEANGEAQIAHPAHVFGAEVALRDYPERLAQEAEIFFFAPVDFLRDSHEVEGGAHAFDDGECRGGRGVRAVEVETHGIPRAAGELDDSDVLEGASRGGLQGEAVEDFMREAVTGAAGDDIVSARVEVLRDFARVVTVAGVFDVGRAAGGAEYGFNVASIPFGR